MDIERNWRPSAWLFQDMIQQNGFPAQWLEKYKLPER